MRNECVNFQKKYERVEEILARSKEDDSRCAEIRKDPHVGQVNSQ